MRELKEKYTYRMGSMPEFMKSLKQRFSRWYNKLHGRRGTLWEERYSATVVSAGSAARMVAAYIDLNPLRAGITNDTKNYRCCSYAEAVAGNELAEDGYVRLYQESDRAGAEVEKLTSSPAAVMQRYRMLMAEEGAEADQDALPMVMGNEIAKNERAGEVITGQRSMRFWKRMAS
jgi:putative transposase